MTTITASRLLADARVQLLAATEELGAIATHLREAASSLDADNIEGFSMDISDALDAAATLESKTSELAAGLARSMTL
jgi:hypothetical protein